MTVGIELTFHGPALKAFEGVFHLCARVRRAHRQWGCHGIRLYAEGHSLRALANVNNRARWALGGPERVLDEILDGNAVLVEYKAGREGSYQHGGLRARSHVPGTRDGRPRHARSRRSKSQRSRRAPTRALRGL